MPVNWTIDLPPIEGELGRLAAVLELLKQMDGSERGRALRYLNDRFRANMANGLPQEKP